MNFVKEQHLAFLLVICLSCEENWNQNLSPLAAKNGIAERADKKKFIDNFSGKVVSHDVVKLAIKHSGILEKFKLTPGQFVKSPR